MMSAFSSGGFSQFNVLDAGVFQQTREKKKERKKGRKKEKRISPQLSSRF